MSALTQIKLIASDLDHTLLDEAGQLPPKFYDTIRAVHNAGMHFVAASGRPLYTLKPMFAPVADCVSLVAENGAIVVRDGEMVYSKFIPKADYTRLIHYTYGKNLGEPILCALDTAYIARSAEKYRDYLDQFFAKLTVVDDLTQVAAQVAKYSVYFPGGETYDIFEPDYATPFKGKFHVTIGGDYFLDMMHADVDKGQALKALGQLLDVTPAQMVTFGDNLNDTEMLALAGTSFVMQAGQKQLDEVATARIGSNSDYAVQQKVNEILANGGQL